MEIFDAHQCASVQYTYDETCNMHGCYAEPSIQQILKKNSIFAKQFKLINVN